MASAIFLPEPQCEMEVSENLEPPEPLGLIIADPLAVNLEQENFQSPIFSLAPVVTSEAEPENEFEAEVECEFNGIENSDSEDILDIDLIKAEEGFTETIVSNEKSTSMPISRYFSVTENVNQNSTESSIIKVVSEEFAGESIIENCNELLPARESFVPRSASTQAVEQPNVAVVDVSTLIEGDQQGTKTMHNNEKSDASVLNRQLRRSKKTEEIVKSMKKSSSALNSSVEKCSKQVFKPVVEVLICGAHSTADWQDVGQTSELARETQEATSDEETADSNASSKNNEKKSKTAYVCFQCSPFKYFGMKSLLDWHVKMFHSTWNCKTCKKTYRDQCSLEEHWKLVHHVVEPSKETAKLVKESSSALNPPKRKSNRQAFKRAVERLKESNLNDPTDSTASPPVTEQPLDSVRKRKATSDNVQNKTSETENLTSNSITRGQKACFVTGSNVTSQSTVNKQKVHRVYTCSKCSPPKLFFKMSDLNLHVQRLHLGVNILPKEPGCLSMKTASFSKNIHESSSSGTSTVSSLFKPVLLPRTDTNNQLKSVRIIRKEEQLQQVSGAECPLAEESMNRQTTKSSSVARKDSALGQRIRSSSEAERPSVKESSDRQTEKSSLADTSLAARKGSKNPKLSLKEFLANEHLKVPIVSSSSALTTSKQVFFYEGMHFVTNLGWGCDICQTFYQSRACLKAHKRSTVHEWCKFCCRRFKVESELIKHLKDEHDFSVSTISNTEDPASCIISKAQSVLASLLAKQNIGGGQKNASEKDPTSIVKDVAPSKERPSFTANGYPMPIVLTSSNQIFLTFQKSESIKQEIQSQQNTVFTGSAENSSAQKSLNSETSKLTESGTSSVSENATKENQPEQNTVFTGSAEHPTAGKSLNSETSKLTESGASSVSENVTKENQPEQNTVFTGSAEHPSAEKSLNSKTSKLTESGTPMVLEIRKAKLSELKEKALLINKKLKVVKVTLSSHRLSKKQAVIQDKVHFLPGLGWGCDICGMFYTKLGRIKEHKNYIHYSLNEFVCEICQTVFESTDKFKIHENNCGPNRYECPACGNMYAKINRYEEHYKLKHKPFSDTYTCLDCSPNKRFYNKSELYSHVKMQHVNRYVFPCKACRKPISEQHMAQHMRIHERKKLQCRHCKQHFTSIKSLKDHLLKTHNIDFPCKFCNKFFKSKPEYVKHLKEHEKERSFICEHCAKAFFTMEHLTTHLKSHEEKQFICEHCSKGFVLKHQLNAHLRTIACGGDAKSSSKRRKKV